MSWPLPPELLESILGFLYPNRYHLKACALVCREWKTPSQRYFFHTIMINAHDHWIALTRLLSQSPHLRPLVKVVDIDTGCLEEHFSFDELSPDDILFPELECLSMESIDNLSILHHLPALKTLSFNEAITDPPLPGTHLPITLHKICYVNYYRFLTPSFVQWINATETASAQSLSELTLGFGSQLDRPFEYPVTLINDFLATHTNVKFLTLELSVDRPASVNFDIAFGVITSVTHLSIHAYPYERLVEDVFMILRSKNFPNVVFLEVNLEGDLMKRPYTYPKLPERVDFRTLVVPRNFALQLVKLNVTLPETMPVEDRATFLSFFGEANRPEILNFQVVEVIPYLFA